MHIFLLATLSISDSCCVFISERMVSKFLECKKYNQISQYYQTDMYLYTKKKHKFIAF